MFYVSQEEENFDYDLIVQEFENICILRQNATLPRYEFLAEKQKEG